MNDNDNGSGGDRRGEGLNGPGQPGPQGQENPYGPQGQPGQPGPYGHPGQQGHPGQPVQVDPNARKKSGKLPGWLSLAGSVLVILAVVGIFIYTRPNGAPEVGDCIAEQERFSTSANGDVMPETLDCSDPEAKYKVVSVRENADAPQCLDVDGATGEIGFYGADIEGLCLAGKDDDPKYNLNTIQVGECVVVEDGDKVRRAECNEPEAMSVRAVLTEPGTVPPVIMTSTIEQCAEAGVPEAEQIYGWGIGNVGMSYDRAVCLAPN